MTRRQDAATATVGAGLTAGGGLLRHLAVNDLIKDKGKQPRFHGPAIIRHGSLFARRSYGAGALIGLVGAPALAIGGTRLVRPKRDEITKADRRRSFISEGLVGTGSALAERGQTFKEKVPAKARAAGYAANTSVGALGVLGARLALRHKAPGVKAIASPIVGVLAAAGSTPLSSRVVRHVAPGYEVTPAGVKRKRRVPKRASSASYNHQATPRSFQADIYKAALPYGRRYTSLVHTYRPDRLMPRKKRIVGRKNIPLGSYQFADELYGPVVRGVQTGFGKADYDDLHYARVEHMLKKNPELKRQVDEFLASAKQPPPDPAREVREHINNSIARLNREQIRVVSAPVRRKMSGATKISLGLSAAAGLTALAAHHRKRKVSKADSSRGYRLKVTAAGSLPVVGYPAQAYVAGAGINSPKHRHRAEATQFASAAGGDVLGATAGGHLAAHLAEHHEGFNRLATKTEAKLDRARQSVGLKPRVLKPAGAGGGAMARTVRAGMKPLHGKYAAAGALGALAGTMVAGNAAQQLAISHNLKRHVGKADTPGMTRKEQQKQLKRRTRLIALNTMGATVGAAGLATFAASKHPHLVMHRPALESATLGLGALGGGIGSYGGFKRAKVERRDVKAQRKALGFSKSLPGQSALHLPKPVFGMPTPAGALKTKVYTASSFRQTPTGKLVRVKAGMR